MPSVTVYLPSRARDVERFFEGGERGEKIKENSGRKVWRLPSGDGALYVKWFPPSILRDRAAIEAKMLQALAKTKIRCPKLVATARDDSGSYVVTEEVPDAEPLSRILGQRPRVLLASLANVLRRMHDAGFDHQDFHVGNVLVQAGELYVLDVHRARRVRSLSKSRRLDAVVFAALSIYERVPLTEVARFFRECGVDLSEAFRRLRRKLFQHWSGRDDRSTVEGSGYGVRDGLYFAKGVALDELLETVKSGPWKILKQKDRENLSKCGGLFLKKTRKALRIWKNAHSLLLRGIPVPPHLACGPGWVVGTWIEAPTLFDYVRSRAGRDDFLFRLARFVRRMHARGVFHKDLKATNVLVGDQFYLVDIDRVDFGTSVSDSDRIFNLAQLNASVPEPVTRTDRLRFLRWYFGRERFRREWIPRIMKITIARKHAWPPR